VFLDEGKILPQEVLEGIRSVYHRNASPDTVLLLTQNTTTDRQAMRSSRRAAKAGIKLEFDPLAVTAPEIWVYLLERENELSDREKSVCYGALLEKANTAWAMSGFDYKRVGILLDNSQSMYGTREHKWRPIAIAMATVDALASAPEYVIKKTSNGRPNGETDLATCFIDLITSEAMCDSVFVVTDGFENAPAGRFREVLSAARAIGVDIPVYQASPQLSGVSFGTKKIADIPEIPVSEPIKSLASAGIIAILKEDVKRGIRLLAERSMLFHLPEN